MGSQQDRPGAGSSAAIGSGGMTGNYQQVLFTSAEGEGRIRSRLAKGEPIKVNLRVPSDQDVEGHALGDTAVLALAAFDDDVEGHAISIHFPDVEQARHFRNNLIAAGALTATLALGVGVTALAPGAQVAPTSPNQAVWMDTSVGLREAGVIAASGTVGGLSGTETAANAREGGAAAPEQVAPVERPIPHGALPPENL